MYCTTQEALQSGGASSGTRGVGAAVAAAMGALVARVTRLPMSSAMVRKTCVTYGGVANARHELHDDQHTAHVQAWTQHLC